MSQVRHPNLIRLLEIFAAETAGTALMLYFGCIGGATGCQRNIAGDLQPALVWGFTVTSVVSIFSHISGAHLNPTVSISALILKRVSIITTFVYIFAQCFGACLGIGLVKLTTYCGFDTDNYCVTSVDSKLKYIEAFLGEFMGTALLIYTVNSSWDPRNSQQMDTLPIKLGFVVATIVFGLGSFTNASFNPARSFGPALLQNQWRDQWLYWAAPFSAAILTTYLYKNTHLKKFKAIDLPSIKNPAPSALLA